MDTSPVGRPSDDPVHGAARELAVIGLVNARLDPRDPRRALQTAGAVAGAAEAAAMIHATAVAAATSGDPMSMLDEITYRAARHAAFGARPDHTIWSIWTLRRARAHLSAMIDQSADPEFVAAATMLDAAYALLSAYAHRDSGDDLSHQECVEQARTDCRSANSILARPVWDARSLRRDFSCGHHDDR